MAFSCREQLGLTPCLLFLAVYHVWLMFFKTKLFLQFLCNRVPLYIYGVKAPSGISSGQIPDLITYQLSKESSLKPTSTQLLQLTSLIKFPSQAIRKSPCLVTPFRHHHLLPHSSPAKRCSSHFEIRQMVVGFESFKRKPFSQGRICWLKALLLYNSICSSQWSRPKAQT